MDFGCNFRMITRSVNYNTVIRESQCEIDDKLAWCADTHRQITRSESEQEDGRGLT